MLFWTFARGRISTMPSGEVHYAYYKKAWPIVIAASVIIPIIVFFVRREIVSYAVEFSVWFVFWYHCGRWIDCDLDLLGITSGEGRLLRELDLLGVFILPVTTFYAASIGYIVKTFRVKGAIGGTHRTWLTHSIIPGTVIRQALICLCLHFLVHWATFGTNVLLNGTINFHPYDVVTFLLAQFAGLGAADAIHIALDNHGGE